MPNISKPNDINNVWAATGDIVAPSTEYVANGWESIIPPREYFNWLDNKQDRFNAHINQHGIPVWDNKTEYRAGQSYSKGSDGNVYKAITTNSNVNPVGDITGAWQAAFKDSGTLSNIVRYISAGTFTYTPPAGIRKVKVTLVGGGGAGGGVPSTNSSVAAISRVGSAGTTSVGIFNVDFTSISVVVGRGGTSSTGKGRDGVDSSFGTKMTAPGGLGGYTTTNLTTPYWISAGEPGSQGAGANIYTAIGGVGTSGQMLFINSGGPGVGGVSTLGGDIGAGGGGLFNVPSRAARVGLVGKAGIVIIEEYT